MEICTRELCTGCSVCSTVCPKKCISMRENLIGHLYPEIDVDLCINCYLCQKMCPSILKLNDKQADKVYASWSLDTNERKESTSGGIATVLADWFIKNKNIVYGSALLHNCIQHIRIEKSSDIKLLQGSKYVESPISEVLPQVMTDLEKGKKVLFIGTPCQCAAVSALKCNNKENLFLVEIICTGVPPQKLLWEHLSKYEKVDEIKFRDSTGTRLSIWRDGRIIYQNPVWNDYFLMGFSKHLYFRESCYRCQYASINRVADLTIGDFWGLGKSEPFEKDTLDGVSVVFINDEKGKELFNNIKNMVFYEERSLAEAINGNPRYYSPSWKNKNYAKFIALYRKYDFKKALCASLRRSRFKYYLYSKKYTLKRILMRKIH